eukprot:TRINITY_DN22483_c0_g1_i1.p1 TRINITY_DN22483_c0_g1~~TRINITY_DN22483_c0_g1_i1.p1  ORF type:complete len:258 (+),score=89.52 TRINITY_DN22483_c0_g1_i1:58-774(+)
MPVDTAPFKEAFEKLRKLVDESSCTPEERSENMQVLADEFAACFRAEVSIQSTVREGQLALSSVLSEEGSEGWTGGYLDGTGSTVTMAACAGWRTLASVAPLADSISYISVTVKELRTVAIGVSVGRPELYIGEGPASWSYQSSGHMIHNGQVVADCVAPKYVVGDVISVLLDKENGFLAFYKNGQLAGVPFDGLDVAQPFNFALSCRMSPCTLGIEVKPLSREQLQKLKAFPVFIGA